MCKIGRLKLGGVYRKGDEGTKHIQEWVTITKEVARTGRGLAIGDRNAHYLDWPLKTNRDNRRTQLREGMAYLSLNVVKEYFQETFRRGN